jgi:hypothetical protein
MTIEEDKDREAGRGLSETVDDALVRFFEDADDWMERRQGNINVLRTKGNIPEVLLRLVDHFKERARVSIMFRVEGGALKHEVIVAEQQPSNLVRDLAEILATQQRIEKKDEDDQMTASEALAYFLKLHLADLKDAKRRGSPGARAGDRVPRSVIAEMAADLLQSSELWGYPPGPRLVALFRELLNIESIRQGHPRALPAQSRAAELLARDPRLGPTQLAKQAGVNKSSVSRWLKDPSFKAKVVRAKESIANREKREAERSRRENRED